MNKKFLIFPFFLINFFVTFNFPAKTEITIAKKNDNKKIDKNKSSGITLRTKNELRLDPLIKIESFNVNILSKENEKNDFKNILNLFNKKKYKKCIFECEKFQENYMTSKARPTVYLYAAVANFMLRKNSEATTLLKIFLEIYPFKKEAVFAKYLIALCNYDDIVSIHKDTKSIRRSYKHFVDLYNEFSDEKDEYTQKYIIEAKKRIIEINDYFAEIDISVGKNYLLQESFIAAMNRFKSVVDNYFNNSFREEACFRLIESQLFLKMFDEAKKTNKYMNLFYKESLWTKLGNNLIKNY